MSFFKMHPCAFCFLMTDDGKMMYDKQGRAFCSEFCYRQKNPEDFYAPESIPMGTANGTFPLSLDTTFDDEGEPRPNPS